MPPIQTSLTRPETLELQHLARDHLVVEVGAAYGYSTIAMALVAEQVVSIDHHAPLDSFQAMRANLKAYGVADKVVCFVAFSQQVLPALERRFHLAFIDGGHTAPEVEADILNAMRVVLPGGFIACHDYGEENLPEIKPVCDRLLPDGHLVDTLWVKQL